MPANVSVNMRAIVTAGLANEVELVNQYAAPMYAPTAAAVAEPFPVRGESEDQQHETCGGDRLPDQVPARCTVVR